MYIIPDNNSCQVALQISNAEFNYKSVMLENLTTHELIVLYLLAARMGLDSLADGRAGLIKDIIKVLLDPRNYRLQTIILNKVYDLKKERRGL